METGWNHAVLQAMILTGNHWGIAVLLFVAVFVGTETLHEAQVALSQELARWSKDKKLKNGRSKRKNRRWGGRDSPEFTPALVMRPMSEVFSSQRDPPPPGRMSHPELLLQLRAACWVGREDAVDVSVQLGGGHLCLSPQNVFHQSIVDENVLLLQTQNEEVP